MKPAEHITAILRPHLDERGSIDIAAAEELLRNSDFDLDDFDPEGEGLANVLADMQLSFRIEHGPEADSKRATTIPRLPHQSRQHPSHSRRARHTRRHHPTISTPMPSMPP